MKHQITPEIVGSSVLIVGFGREGQSVYRWLRIHYPEIRIGIADAHLSPDKTIGLDTMGVRLYQGEQYLSHVANYETVIRSPGVSPYAPELTAFLRNGGHMTSATNIFFSLVAGMTIGVTGTKGKSTTSSLIAHVLSEARQDVRLVGNIGSPMLDELDNSGKETTFVLELSSHQLYDCRFSPHTAVVLGIVSEHLDYYPNFLEYVRAKSNICRHQSSSDLLVYNPGHTIVREMVQSSHASRVMYAQAQTENLTTFIREGIIYYRATLRGKETRVLSTSDVPLLGNVENVLAAATVAMTLRIPAEKIENAIKPFKSLPHRLEYVGEYRGIRFYNDSLATIPQATIHALEALGPSVSTLIAGGYDRHIEYSELGAYLRSHPIDTLILFPDTGEKIWRAIGDVTQTKMIHAYHVSTMEEAVRLAFEKTPTGNTCVLSPAAASFNQFKDYADRGDQFKECVKRLGQP